MNQGWVKQWKERGREKKGEWKRAAWGKGGRRQLENERAGNHACLDD